jgi:hypothetical protein
MSVAYRDEGDARLAGSDRSQVGVAGVSDTRVASSKTTTAPCNRLRSAADVRAETIGRPSMGNVQGYQALGARQRLRGRAFTE